MNPLISVIVPIYNVEKYIHRCVDSILCQTYANIEIILIDDGSPDNCPRICDEYANLDKRIKVIHKKNEGLGFARNSGLDICSGEFIMFVDSDDCISDDAVQVLYDRMVVDGSDMVVGKHIDVYDDGSKNGAFCSFMKDAVVSKQDLFSMMGQKNYFAVSAWAKLYKHEIFHEIKYPSLKCAEDLWVFTQVVDKCKTISIVDQTIYYYYQRASSLVHQKSEQSKYDEVEATLYTTQFLWQNGFEMSAKKWYARGISKAILFANKGDALKLFKQYFTRHERRQLLVGESMKTRIKWMSLYVPFIYYVTQYAKRIVRRG